jgi:hypothetical protein
VHDGWIRPPGPGAVDADEPRWGHRGGIQIGLSPIPGPRGLIRIFTPYLDQGPDRLLNFLALEPIPQGATERGYSELEPSDLDRQPGKRFWSSTSLADSQPRNPDRPVPGDLRTVDGVERLSLWVHSERFANDARVAVRIEFRSDRPHEFAIETYRLEDSAELSALVVTATMGNFARLRKLQLRDSAVTPSELWPDFDGSHFAEHRRFGVEQLVRTATGGVTVSAEPDETDPAAAEYDDAVNEHWHYVGVPAVQTWEAEDPDPKLVACVNARRVYWASQAPIPGGDAYENVELIEPFRQGRQFIYRVEPLRR